MALNFDFTPQTISWFKDRAAEGRLEFKPPFQRNPVWLPRHKAYLIDTVIRGLPVPEVYVQKVTEEDGKTTYAVIDGQQRLRTFLEFAKNSVTLMQDYSPGREGQTWDDLSKDERVAYWSYRLVVREVSNATEADLRDLFRRLNQHTVVLNSQELRNARFSGQFIQAVTDLADQEYWPENRIVKPAEIRRMLDIEFMAELLIGIMHGAQNKKASLDQFFESYEKEFPDRQQWLARFETTRAAIEKILPNLAATRWRGRSDYYSLFLAAFGVFQGKPIADARAALLRKKLESFGATVTERLTKEGAKKAVSADVAKYATAVEKAASDKDRRVTRIGVIAALLKG